MDRSCLDDARVVEPCLASDALIAPAEVAPAAGRKPYAGPRLTFYGRVPAITLVIGSPGTDSSDRNLKEGFAPVDPRTILARVATLPIETWSYKGERARHLGPMAQDFAAAFGLGADDRHIFPLDAGGVALAALQGLHALVQAQDARLLALERELAALRSGPVSPSIHFQPSEKVCMDQDREDAMSSGWSEPDAPTAGSRAPAPDRPQKAYGRPGLTAYGRVPALTLGQQSPGPPPSDRNLKEGFAPVDPRTILARVATLPIETWSYKGERARHLGPMAQDFAAAFGLGADDRHIFPLDAGGVALAALQGLHALVQAQGARLLALERELAALRPGLVSPSIHFQPSEKVCMDQDREDAMSSGWSEPDAPTAGSRAPAPDRPQKAYGRPELTAYGRVPALTLDQTSPAQDG